MSRFRQRPLAPAPLVNQLPVHSCSLLVLASLGVLGLTLPSLAFAQVAGTQLPAGTLPVLRGVVAGKVVVNSPVAGSGSRLMTIDQADQRVIIDWKGFNIGSDAEVRFNQPSSTASALNRIYGNDPTIIQGKLTANGQVLLINQNGILFDRGAQVNVQSLVASTLNIRNESFLKGALTTDGLSKPAFAGGYDPITGLPTDTRADGSLPGAVLIGLSGSSSAAAPQLTAKSGGSILIFAPRIDNKDGLITAPDGQVILAAGGKAYLALADGSDPTQRGFQVEIEASGGTSINLTDFIRNSGIISADRGNVTLAALAINQNGRVSANTAIQANGSVFLTARTLGGAQAGSVSFGAGSITQVLPDAQDKSTLAENQSFTDRRGEIRVDARTIASSGTLEVPGGKITLTARDATGVADGTGARVYLDQGSLTSVAGNWSDVAYADNLLTFKVTSNELKDSPDQKLGVLKGATVTVDLRKTSPLFDLSGYVAAQKRTVAQKTANGGEIDISSSGSLIQRAGATLDASGGGYRYGAGTAATSVLLGADGKLYDIGTAPEQRPYKGLVDTFTKTYSRWGQTEVFSGGTYGIGKAEAGYVEGKAGGVVNLLSAAGVVLDGTLKGGATAGPNQLASAPRGASLTIGAFSAIENQFSEGSRIGNVGFAQIASDTLGGTDFGVGSLLTKAQTDNVTLSADQLFGKRASGTGNVYAQSAFDSVEINSNGVVRVPEAVRIEGAPGSSLLLRAPQIDVAGSISMPAGNITLQPLATIAPISPELGPANTGVTLRGSGALSVAGVWINNASADGSFVGSALPSARQNLVIEPESRAISTTNSSTLTGGRITIANNSARDAATLLERGSVIDVGGGASLSSTRKLTVGDGGTLSIANGFSTTLSSDWLQADLSGLSFGNGGKLVLSTPRVVIDAADANGTLPTNTTRLSPALFSERGFSSVAVNAVQGIAIESGAQIELKQKTRVIDTLAASRIATGADVRAAAAAVALPPAQLKPMTLSLAAAASTDSRLAGQATLSMAEGAKLVAVAGSTVSLSAVDALRVDGSISAPGGNVSLTLSAPAVGAAANGSTPDLALGSKANISVAGSFVQTPTVDGLVQGNVIGAGTITIAASQAGVVLARGSVLDLRGASQVLETRAVNGGSSVVRQTVDGNAGSLVIRSQGVAELGSMLRASADSAQGAGGAFALELNARDTEPTQPAERRIVVTQQAPAAAKVPATDGPFADAAISIDALQSAGFDKLRLQSENRIELRGDVAANFKRGIRLDAPLLEVSGDGRASLTAASVALGQSLNPRLFNGNDFTLNSQGQSPVVAARTGAGVLSVQASTIDLFGSVALGGVAETRLFAGGDIRLTGRNVKLATPGADNVFGTQMGSLTSTGNLTLSATQIYPSTRTDFTLSVAQQLGGAPVPGGNIVIAGNGKVVGDVYSAGGRVAFVADTIVQGGTVKAPLGGIDLNASSRLELSSGSLTSVSASGLTIPLGTTQDGLSWTYQDNLASGTPNLLTTDSADAKRIGLSGTTIDVRSGATVNLSGGGEVQALEFVKGSGGTNNTLVQPNTYAIIPKAQLSSMPIDTATAAAQDIGFGPQSKKIDTAVYDQLHIGSGAVVPEGDYVLLPGRYALLPGAFLVQLQTGSAYANLQPGDTSQLLNGQTVVAGRLGAAATNVRASRTVGVVVRPGSDATRESDFTVTTSPYFTNLAASSRTVAPRVPIDAGRLVVTNTASLRLAGSFVTNAGTGGTATAPLTGRATEVDISAGKIAVVDKVGDNKAIAADYLQIEGSALSALGGSLLLGGQRSNESDGVRITTKASDIVVANSAVGALSAAELLLSATGSIDVRDGSVLAGSGSTGTTTAALKAEGGGALMRLSAGGQASIDRGSAIDNTTGTIRIDTGAVVNASGALLLDATRTLQSRSGFGVSDGGALSLASSKVSLGETATVANIDDGLVLSNANLASLAKLNALTIKGYEGIDMFGNANVGAATLGRLTLDGNSIRGNALGTAQSAARVVASEVQFVNSGSTTAVGVAPAASTLTIDAQRIVVGAGAKKISGYGSVAMNASSETIGRGAGSLAVEGDWTVTTPKIGVAAGAVQAWQAADLNDPTKPVYSALKLAGSAAAAGTSTDNAAGGRLRLEAGAVNVATTVQARSGTITIAALGATAGDGVTLDRGAVLDASGIAKDFNGSVVVANAGQVELSSARGAVALNSGSTVDVRGVRGGDAGSVRIAAKTLGLGGTLSGSTAGGGVSGAASVDLDSLADFSALNSALNAGSFNESRGLRLHSGNLLVQSDDSVNARVISLAADAGRIDIKGSLNARSDKGGAKVDVWAANGLALTGAQVLADGTGSRTDAAAALSNGGQVRLATSDGTLAFDKDSVIDVRPGAKGQTGSVMFTVARDNADKVSPVQLKGTVLGARGSNGAAASVALEAQRVYDVSGAVTPVKITGYANDHAAFIAATSPAALLGELKGDVSASLRGATHLRTQGDLTIDRPWDLTTALWLANGQSGTLTLRAAGDVTVKTALGMPNDNLLGGDTWNIRLVGGADLTAANPLATQALGSVAANKGNVLISTDNGKVRTGTGSIEVAAAADFRMDALRSVIYTAGQIGAVDAANVAAKPATEETPATPAINYDRWATRGGSISIAAGRDAMGNSDEWITEWLRRPRGTPAEPAKDATADAPAKPAIPASAGAEWWAYRPNFGQGLGTLAGGDISVVAGRDVNSLSAMAATTGRSLLQPDGSRTLDVQGGGQLQVRAGNDIVGGSYLVGRGEGRLDAGGSVGGATPTQLYLMGASSGAVPDQATFSLAAGKSVDVQSVNNPTAMLQTGSSGSGPSFGAGVSRVATFFSYSADSSVDVLAKAGDVSMGSQARDARRVGSTTRVLDTTPSGAYPASLSAAALEGDVKLAATRSTFTYPSLAGSLALLAQGSVLDPNLTVSELAPGSVANANAPVFSIAPLSGDALVPTASQMRIIERPATATDGYRFDLQALAGDVAGSGADPAALRIPAASRVRAGRDITNIGLTLQNLKATDLSEVRADVGDVRTAGLEIRGPGSLLVQAGRDIDLGQSGVRSGSANLGGLIATGSNANPNLPTTDAAQLFLVAGVKGNIDPASFKGVYDSLVALNGESAQILAFYRALNGDPDAAAVSSASSVQELVARDKIYAPYVDFMARYPSVLQAYQAAAKSASLPLGVSSEATQAAALYALLNKETDAAKIVAAKSISELVQGTQGGTAYAAYSALDAKYPRVFADYRARRGRGALPEGLTPILLSDVLAGVVASAVPAESNTSGNILTFRSSIQTYGGGVTNDKSCVGQCATQGDINLWAPNGNILAGLTTPAVGSTIGVVTNGGGAIRSVLSGDFTINQGKVLTAQGGDILIFSSGASIDAGRGAKTSVSTPPPVRTAITTVVNDETVIVGYQYTLPASASGSGIQTLSSDPDGLGPRTAPQAGSIYLFAPAGTIDAGEAGIRSGGNIVINAQTVLNGSNIAASGSSVGVPVATTGSLASSLATGGTATTASKAGDDAAGSATKAARAAAAAEGLQKPTILTVEVLGFGDKNCKEKDKDCFAK